MVFTKATQRFLKKTKQPQRQPQPQQFQRQNFSQRRINMFQKGNTPDPLSSSMNLLFGSEGEDLIGNTVAIFPQLNTSDAGDIISSVQQEMFGNQEPQQRRMPMRRRRR